MEVYKKKVSRRLKHESLKKKFLEDTYVGFGKENVLSTNSVVLSLLTLSLGRMLISC